MADTEAGNVFDKFDDAPSPNGTPPAQTRMEQGRPMSSTGTLPTLFEDQATREAREAKEARETAGRVQRQRAVPEYSWMSTPPPEKSVPEGGNVYDRFDADPKDDGVALMERLRLNRQDSYYRGSIAGSARLAALAHIYQTPDGPNETPERKAINKQQRDEYVSVISDLAAYDQLQPYDSTMEAMAAFGGQLEGTMISPESWIGWGAKGSTFLGRAVKSGLEQGAIQMATDPVVQELSIAGGGQKEYDWYRTLAAGALGFTIGGGAHVVGEGLGKIVGQMQLRKQIFDLGREDAAFDAPRHAIWALDPNTGIVPEGRPQMDVVRPQMPEERGAENPTGAQETAAGREEPTGTSDAIWANKDHDIPVSIVDEPPQTGPDGRQYQKVIYGGRESYVPADELRASARYQPGMEHSFDDAVKAKQADLAQSYGAAQPKGSQLKEDARFAAFNDEVGDVLQGAVEQHGLDPQQVRVGDIWKFYDRAAGESPEEALERAVGRWVTEEERRSMQSIDMDAQLQRDLDEWSRAYASEVGKSYPTDVTNFKGEVISAPSISLIERNYRPFHLPEEGPGERLQRSNAAEGGNLSEGRAAQPETREATAGAGAEPAVLRQPVGGGPTGGEAGGSAAAAVTRGERLGGPSETLGGIPETDLQAIAQRRKGSLMAGEQVRQAASAPSPAKDVAVRSLQQQSMDLAKILDFPLRQGRVQMRDAGGVFNLRSGVVRVQEVPDFDVVSHEAGHAIESKIGPQITALTNQHAGELRLMDYDQTKQRVNEGFAEYVRMFLTNPAYATAQAPGFTLAFERYMAANQPDMLAQLRNAATAYSDYLNAPSVDAVGSVLRSKSEDVKGIAKVQQVIKEDGLPSVIKSVMQKSYDAILDEDAPMTRAVRELGAAIKERTGKLVDLKSADNPDVLMRLATRSRQAATRDLMDGVRPYHEIAPEGPSLADAITDAVGATSVWGKWDEAKRGEFSTYLIARRATSLWDKFDGGEIPNPPVAFSRADAVQAMADLEAANPTFKNASDMVHNYTRQLLRKSYEGGLINADTYGKLLEEEFYVPFNRDLSDRPNAGGAGGGEGPGTVNVVQRLRGSSRDIIDPLESIMAQTFMVNRTLAHNDVVKALVSLSQKAGPEGGKYAEVIPAHEARKYIVDLEQAIRNRAKDIGMAPVDADSMITALTDPTGGSVTGTYFKMEQAAARGEPIVFYREGGELRAARIMAGGEGHPLYELLTAAPEPVRDLWGDIVSLASSIKRSSIVTNPTFALTNYMRDQVAASILRSDYVPFYSGIRGIKDEFLQANNAVLYGYAGGVAGGASVGPVERAFTNEVDALKKKGYLVQRLGGTRDLLTQPSLEHAKEAIKGLLELSSFTEAGTRNSIFATVFETSKKKGLSDYEAMVEAAFQAQDILDFSRHGSRTLAVRNFLPFLNAHLQGLDKARRTLWEPLRLDQNRVFERDTADFNNAVNGWLKAGAVGGSLGAAWAALMWGNEAYRDASPYFKGTHLVVPVGNKIFVVPKPFELGMGFTLGEYAYHALAQNDPRAARMFGEAMWDTISPPNPIADMPIVTPAIELALGKSLFTGRDIVPESIQRLPTEQQYTDRTSELGKWIGAQIGVSPIKVDYAIGSQFATWGRDVMALSQGVSENSPAASLDDMLFFRRFVKDPTRSSDVTTRFWKYAGRTTGEFNQAVAGYNDLVRDAVTRGAPLSTANEFLSKLPSAERAFVTLKSAANESGKPIFSPDERRLHPLQSAYDSVEVLNNLRRELATNSQTTWGARERVMLNPEQRRLLLENVRELTALQMRNSLVIMGEGGFQGRPVLDPEDTMAKIRHLSPAVADEIATRFATAKIYNVKEIQKAWPKLRDELLRFGSDADIGGLAIDARAAGYEFGGARTKRPGIIRQRIEGTPVPTP